MMMTRKRKKKRWVAVVWGASWEPISLEKKKQTPKRQKKKEVWSVVVVVVSTMLHADVKSFEVIWNFRRKFSRSVRSLLTHSHTLVRVKTKAEDGKERKRRRKEKKRNRVKKQKRR
jgi:hypothetical protein